MAVQTAASDGLFDPALTELKVQDYSTVSKGYKASGVSDLLDGIGTVAGQALGVADKYYDYKASSAAREDATDIVNMRQADLVSVINAGDTPEGLTRGMERMTTATAAKAQGRISDTTYYTLLDTTARTLKSKYPGHIDSIDREMQKATGVNPANALMRSLEQEARDAIKPKQNEFEKSYQQAKQTLTLPADFFDPGRREYYSSNPNEFDKQVYKNMQHKATVGRGNAAVADSLERRQSTAEGATAVAADEVGKLYTDAVTRVERQLGGSYKETLEAVKTGMVDGKPATPEQKQALVASLDALEADLSAKAKSLVETKKVVKDKTYKDLGVDPEKALQPLRDRIKIYKDAILNRNYGIVGIDLTSREADSLSKTWIAKYPINGTLTTLSTALPPDAVTAAVNSSSKLPSPEATAVSHGATAAILNGSSSLGGLQKEIFGASGLTPAEAAAATRDVIQTAHRNIADLTVPIESRLKTAQALYTKNPDYLKQIRTTDDKGKPSNDQLKTFQVMVSPKVTKDLWDLSLQGQDPIYKAYAGWATQQFSTLFREQIQTMPQLNGTSAGLTIKWDPKSTQFYTVANPDTAKFAGPSLPMDRKRILDQVSNMNEKLRPLSNVYAITGDDPNRWINNIFKSWTSGQENNPLLKEMADSVNYSFKLTPAESKKLEKVKDATPNE